MIPVKNDDKHADEHIPVQLGLRASTWPKVLAQHPTMVAQPWTMLLVAAEGRMNLILPQRKELAWQCWMGAAAMAALDSVYRAIRWASELGAYATPGVDWSFTLLFNLKLVHAFQFGHGCIGGETPLREWWHMWGIVKPLTVSNRITSTSKIYTDGPKVDSQFSLQLDPHRAARYPKTNPWWVSPSPTFPPRCGHCGGGRDLPLYLTLGGYLGGGGGHYVQEGTAPHPHSRGPQQVRGDHALEGQGEGGGTMG